ncbi:MAG: hypothetical protein ABIH23_21155 [bacterium]
MDNKSRSVAIQIAAVAILALGLIVYSFMPGRVEKAKIRLDVQDAHRGLKKVLSTAQRYSEDHDGEFVYDTVTNLANEEACKELVIDERLEDLWCGNFAYLKEIPRSPFPHTEQVKAPIILGRHEGTVSYWYAYVTGPGFLETPGVQHQIGPPALSSDQWYAVTNGLYSPGYIYRDTMGNVSTGGAR